MSFRRLGVGVCEAGKELYSPIFGICLVDKRKMTPSCLGNALGQITVPIKNALGKRNARLNTLWPHEIFSALYHYHQEYFLNRVCGGSYANIRKLWANMTKHPSYADHPMRRHTRFEFRDKRVPFSIHGDGITALGVGKKSGKHCNYLSWSP